MRYGLAPAKALQMQVGRNIAVLTAVRASQLKRNVISIIATKELLGFKMLKVKAHAQLRALPRKGNGVWLFTPLRQTMRRKKISARMQDSQMQPNKKSVDHAFTGR